jgi:hypothetical protein
VTLVRRVVPLLSILTTLLAGGCSSLPGRPVPTGILLVTVDSLRPDRIDFDAGGRHPALARLAAEGVRFDQAWSSAPWTAPSLVSIFTGLAPPTHGVEVRDDTTPPSLPTLPRGLAAAGWRIGNFGFFSGVSYYRNLGLPPPDFGGRTPPDALVDWLGKTSPPFFAWIHLLETHMPHGSAGEEAPELRVCGSPALERLQTAGTLPIAEGWRFEAGDRERLLPLYDADVDALDRRIDELLGTLDRLGLADSTLVVLTADHGEELLEEGWVGHASTSGEAKLVPELLRVPLLVRGPGIRRGAVVRELVQGLDLAPTLLDLAGLPIPPECQGKSLARLLEGLEKDDPASGRFAFFSTSTGGHRTPAERREERLLGITDGVHLHVERVGAPSSPSAGIALWPPFASPLARWRGEQLRARLRLLARSGEESPPNPAEVEGWPESLPLREPADGASLTWDGSGGTLRLAWDGEEPGHYWVEYEAGSGIGRSSGRFPVDSVSLRFGPFPRAFWNDLADVSPFRFRILDATARRRSPWRSFRVEPAAVSGERP